MSSSVRGTPSTAQGTSLTSLAITIPAGVQAGDIIVVQAIAKCTASLSDSFCWSPGGVSDPKWISALGGGCPTGTAAGFGYQGFYAFADGTEGGTALTLHWSNSTDTIARTQVEAIITCTVFAGLKAGVAPTVTYVAGGGPATSSTYTSPYANGAVPSGGAMVGYSLYTMAFNNLNGPSNTLTAAAGFTQQNQKLGTTVCAALFTHDVASGTPANVSVNFPASTGWEAYVQWYFPLLTDQTVSITGLSATGTLGSFSVRNGSNNSVNVTGLHGTGQLGGFTAYKSDYGVTGLFATGYPAGTMTRSTYISAGVCEVVPYGMPGFQGNAFQGNVMAFQMERFAFPGGLQGAGAVGSVVCANLYDFAYWQGMLGGQAPMQGALGTGFYTGVSYAITGVYGTGQVGVLPFPTLVAVSGIYGTGAVGSLSFTYDCIFELPKRFRIIYPKGEVGSVTVHFDASFTTTGVVGTLQLGAIDPAVRYAVTGVQAAGQVGAVTYAASVHPTGVYCEVQLGGFVAGWVQLALVTGVEGTLQLGTARVVNPNTFYGPQAPAAAGQVGSVAFRIDSAAAVLGVPGTGVLGVPSLSIYGAASPVGLQALAQLGNATPLGMPSMSVQSTGGVGQVSFIIDCNVTVLGLEAGAALGTVGETRSSEAHVAGVEATGYIGSAATAHQSAHDHRNDIYVRLQ